MSEYNGRCKVVAILPTKIGEKSIKFILSVLWCSEANHSLDEKMHFGWPYRGEHQFLKVTYRDINPEFCYGELGKEYLMARKVKNIRCKQSKKDCFETTLYWTEMPKYISKPDLDSNSPLPPNPADCLKQVCGETEGRYTYSNRSDIEAAKRRQSADRDAR